MKQYTIHKQKIDDFIKTLLKKYGVVSPVEKNGIICFHDYDPPKFKGRLIGVEQAVDELMTDGWQKIDVKGSVVAFRKVK